MQLPALGIQPVDVGNSLLRAAQIEGVQDAREERQVRNRLLEMQLGDRREALADKRRDLAAKQAPVIARLLGNAKNEQEWAAGLETLKGLGMAPPTLPPYSPEAAAMVRQAADALMNPKDRYQVSDGQVFDLNAAGGPAAVAGAPKARNVQTVTTKDGVFVLTPEGKLGDRLGARPSEKEEGGPGFGNSLQGRALGILLDPKADPGSPEYATAYYEAYLTPKLVQTEKGFVPVLPPVPPNIRPPTNLAGAPGAGAAPQPGAAGPSVGPVLPGTEKTPSYTGEQSNAAGFANRVAAANAKVDELERGGYDPTNARDAYIGALPGVGNFARSDQGQQYEQAKRDFVTAVLRKESGAAISHGEFVTEEKKYFPQPGDRPDVIAQKRAARARAFESLKGASGPAYEGMFGKKTPGPNAAGVVEYDYDPATKTLKPRAQ